VGKGGKKERRRFIKNFWEMENFHLECEGEEGKKIIIICV
jgi:hypothetical protein